MKREAIMRIEQPLPEEFAEKWRRLLAFQGGDPEALALAAVELLWKKYGRDVERDERTRRKLKQKGAAEIRRVDRAIDRSRSRLKDVPALFVGRHVLTADAKGAFALPEALLFMAGGDYRLVSNNGEYGIVPVGIAGGRKLSIDTSGKFKLPPSVVRSFKRSDRIVLIGKLLYLAIQA